MTATFQIKHAFQITGRQFFILGELLSGKIAAGMTADLTILGIDKKPVIDTIEFALQREGDKTWEDIGLGFIDLTEKEKELLKSRIPFSIRLIVEQQNPS